LVGKSAEYVWFVGCKLDRGTLSFDEALGFDEVLGFDDRIALMANPDILGNWLRLLGLGFDEGTLSVPLSH
jgi:hypothetical protein